MPVALREIDRWPSIGAVGVWTTAGLLTAGLLTAWLLPDGGAKQPTARLGQTADFGEKVSEVSVAPILEAVARNQNISVSQARKRLDRQTELARVADRMNAALDTSKTAGVYIDQDAGQLVVTVTEEGASGQKQDGQDGQNELDELDELDGQDELDGLDELDGQDGLDGLDDVREEVVEYSSDDLARAEAVVERAVTASRATALSWAVDVRANAVIVAVEQDFADTDETEELFQEVRVLGSVVRTRTVKSVEDTAEDIKPTEAVKGTVAAGDWVGVCSAGWSARDRNQKDVLLTAGNCVSGDDPNWTHARQPLGEVVDHSNGPQDWAIIRYDAGSRARPSARVNLYDGYGLVTGHSRAPVGSVICKSGGTSHLTCGTITASEISSIQNDEILKDDVILKDMVGMRMCSDYGDGGGAVFVPHADGTVTAQGMVSSGIEACNPVEGEGDTNIIDNGMMYQPIDTVLREQGLTLHTHPR